MNSLNDKTADILVEIREEREAQLNRYEHFIGKFDMIVAIMVIAAAIMALCK